MPRLQGLAMMLLLAACGASPTISHLLPPPTVAQPSPAARTPSVSAGSPPASLGSPQKTVPPELEGRFLAFAREDGVYVARADGSELRRVTDIEDFEFQPDWSPDGRRLALRVDPEEGPGGTWVVNVDGTQATNLSAESGIPGGSADWSPDGERIAFVGIGPRDRFFGIWLMDADGTNPIRLTPDEWEAQYPAWSPDGELIAFTRVVAAQNSFDIWTMNAGGTDLRHLTDDPGEDNYAAWSPDGQRLVFSSTSRPGGPDGLYLMQRDGSGVTFLVEGGEPNWEPGSWIAYDCPVSDEGAICVVNPDDGQAAELPLGPSAFPAWAPD